MNKYLITCISMLFALMANTASARIACPDVSEIASTKNFSAVKRWGGVFDVTGYTHGDLSWKVVLSDLEAKNEYDARLRAALLFPNTTQKDPGAHAEGSKYNVITLTCEYEAQTGHKVTATTNYLPSEAEIVG